MGLDFDETVLGGENKNGIDCLVGLQLWIIGATEVKENTGTELELNRSP